MSEASNWTRPWGVPNARAARVERIFKGDLWERLGIRETGYGVAVTTPARSLAGKMWLRIRRNVRPLVGLGISLVTAHLPSKSKIENVKNLTGFTTTALASGLLYNPSLRAAIENPKLLATFKSRTSRAIIANIIT